ncbi:MAG TPA: HNH endonuclease signature motif containing protein [Candidatus Saccharimonadales bacterium]|nr:HNH endonuclease signature motif containing protein [Candidatus Saccharimonadales bacterium]
MDRRLGRALEVLRDRQVYLELGWIRLGDYAAECLGLSLRTVQDLIRTERSLAALPLTAAAFDAGQLSASHVRALAHVATVENEKTWIASARRMDVRSLRRAVAESLARKAAAGGPGAAPDGAGADAGPPGDNSSLSLDTDGVRTSGVGSLETHLEEEDDEPELKRLSISAPVWVISWWRDAVTLARRLTGRALPHGPALETVLAESQDVIGSMTGSADGSQAGRLQKVRAVSGQSEGPRERFQVGPMHERGTAGSPGEAHDLSVPGEAAAAPPTLGISRGEADSPPNIDPSATSESPADIHQDSGCVGKEPGASARPSMSRPSAPSPEACALDAQLRRLVIERQRVESMLAERLGMDRAAGAHLLDGGGSFERYASRHYGISPRRIYYLLSLQRTLGRLAALKRAYVSGRLTLRQTILVGRIATRRTAPAWIRRAERITLRRLEDEVEYWELLRVERPGVWERLKGHPLPDGIVLVPGHAPRLHAFASRLGVGGAPGSVRNDATGDLHAFARPEPRVGSFTGTGDDLPTDASSFIEALSASVAATPLPARMGVLRMRVEPETLEMWHDTVSRVRALSDEPLEEWEVLVLALRRFFQVCDNKETRGQRREHPILERDGWRCAFPGCRSIGSGTLQTHHVLFRSHGGTDDDPGLLVALCNAHHQHLLHQGYIRCSGRAPDALVWELGTGGNLPAWRIYRGDVLVGGRALMPTAAAMGIAM